MPSFRILPLSLPFSSLLLQTVERKSYNETKNYKYNATYTLIVLLFHSYHYIDRDRFGRSCLISEITEPRFHRFKILAIRKCLENLNSYMFKIFDLGVMIEHRKVDILEFV